MNHTYRIIYNYTLGMYQCVSEIAKNRGKSSNKNTKSLGLLTALALTSGSVMAEDVIFNGNHSITTNRQYNNSIIIANKENTQATVTVTNGATLSMAAKGNRVKDHKDEYKSISVGHKGIGTLNINNATVQSADVMLLGAYAHSDNGVITNNSKGTVNINSGGKLLINEALIIGDGGHGEITASRNSQINAKEIYVGGLNQGRLNLKDSTVSAQTVVLGDDEDYNHDLQKRISTGHGVATIIGKRHN